MTIYLDIFSVYNPATDRGGSSSRDPTKNYIFDLVYGPDSTQLELYNESARPIVDAVLEGYNGGQSMTVY